MADEVEPASKRRREGEAQQAPMRRQPRPLPGTPDWGSVLSAAQLQPAYLVRSRVALPPVTAACVNSARLALGDPTDGGHLCAYVATGGAVYRHTGGTTSRLPQLCARGEVQSLALAGLVGGCGALLASADAYGCACVAALPPRGGGGRVYCLTPPTATHEPGWAGAAWACPGWGGGSGGSNDAAAADPGWCAHAASPAGALAVARRLAKCVDVYDGELHAWCAHTAARPAALAWLPGCGPLLAVAEGPHLVTHDVRSPSPASRLAVSPACDLLSLCAAPASAAPGAGAAALLACGGTERAVCVFDARSGRPLRRLAGFSRKAVTHLAFVPHDPRAIFAAAADQQLLCRRWDVGGDGGGGGGGGGDSDGDEGGAPAAAAAAAAAAGFSFRADGRWAGLACRGRDAAAFADSGELFLAQLRL